VRAWLAAGIAALAVVPAGSVAATAPRQVVVKVGDDYFAPLKLKVASGTTVAWKWLPVNGDTHDVFLKRGPRGVKHFHSDPAAASFKYKRKLTVKGTYTVICSFHAHMVMTITVR
jgi:plastocyanin